MYLASPKACRLGINVDGNGSFAIGSQHVGSILAINVACHHSVSEM